MRRHVAVLEVAVPMRGRTMRAETRGPGAPVATLPVVTRAGATPAHEVAADHERDYQDAFIGPVERAAAEVDHKDLAARLSVSVPAAVAWLVEEWLAPGWSEGLGAAGEGVAEDVIAAVIGRLAEEAEGRAVGAHAARLWGKGKDGSAAAAAANEADGYARAWLQSRTAELVTQVSDSTREALRAAVEAGYDRWGNYQRVAEELLTTDMGLDSGRQRRLERYRANLADQGLDAETIAERAARFAAELRVERALLIASYESVRAGNAGQLFSWRSAQDHGLVPAGARREWIAALDERTCPDCVAMDGVTVGLQEPFPTPAGLLDHVNDIHVRCRCSEGLVW